MMTAQKRETKKLQRSGRHRAFGDSAKGAFVLVKLAGKNSIPRFIAELSK
jgi:hypothetical protein